MSRARDNADLGDSYGALAVGVTGGSGLNALSASNLSAGTVPDARFPATLPAASGTNLTALPAANVTGVLPVGVTGGSGLTALGTVTSGTLAAGVNLEGANVFKHIKHYGTPSYSYGGSAENIKGWVLKTSGSFLNKGTNFSIDANGELTFPEAGFWMVTAHLAFYKATTNNLNTNMEPLMQIYNGSAWGNSTYIRVGEQYDGASYVRGGGSKISFYDILSTSYKWRMYPPSGASGITIADSTSVEFVYIGAT